MATTFLQLTNRILKAFNEVQLDSSNFLTSDGFYEEARDAVNQAIFDLHVEEDMAWPWAWGEANFNTVAGTTLYTPTSAATVIDWDSFYLNKDVPDNISPDHLPSVDYKIYKSTGIKQQDDNLTSDSYSKPTRVVRRPDNKIILTTVPDQVYNIVYEYYTVPTALAVHSDTTIVPDSFIQLIIDKGLYYGYMFRDNVEQAQLAQDRYERNVNRVRRILIPQFQNTIALV